MAGRDALIRRGRFYVLACVLVALLAGADPPARAAPLSAPTFTINSISDVVASPPLDNGICETLPGNKTCTLRAAIMKANHWPGGGVTIVFAPQLSGIPIPLEIPQSGLDGETVGDLNITQTVTILGSGVSKTIIDGNGSVTNDRVFSIDTGMAVTMTGVTIQGGHVSGVDGGGLWNAGMLLLDHSAVISNSAVPAVLGGGGILTVLSARLTVVDSTIAGNHTSGDGGGINSQGSIVAVYSSTIGNNTGSYGGGIFDILGNTTLLDTTISGNSASNAGGGLYSFGGTTTVVNSTVSSNQADHSGGGIWSGCSMCASVLNLLSATIANNRADAQLNGSGTGGGIYNRNENDNIVNLQNSLIAGNDASEFFTVVWERWPNDCSGALASQGHNLIAYQQSDCTLTGGPQDQTNIAANLGPLQDNGGPTGTHALLPGSPAIDAGNPGGCNDQFGATLATDQRGRPRQANGAGATRCDIGAYEVQRLLDLPLVLR